MRNKCSRLTWGKLLPTLLIALGAMICVVPAWAETLSVSGYDSFYATHENDGSVDILTVTGAEGQTVYINMYKGKKTIASHLAFTLEGENAQTDANGDMVGMVSVSFNGTSFLVEDEYQVQVYADREQTELLYEGTVSTVFARYDGESTEPMALRTLAQNEDRAFSVPQTLAHNGITYELASADPQEVDGRLVYDYKPAKNTPESITAHVSYYNNEDASSNPIRVDEIDLALGESKDVAIESIVAAQDGALYRTLQLANKLTLSYPGTTEYAVMCKKLSGDWNKVGSFYTATIKYVDTEGNGLGVTDTVIVNKTYIYTAPTNLYISNKGTVQAYKLAPDTSAVLTLNPGDAEEAAEYLVVYQKLADDEERTWTVVLENGSLSPTDANRVMGRVTLRGLPGETVTFDATKDAADYVDYSAYQPIASCAKTFEHTFSVANMDVEQVVYFVPADYVAPEAYYVTVNYVNIANNEVITTQSYTASPSMRADLEISSPESFSANGVEWVRLDGQEQPIRHGFYSKARTYAVYYRDINDDLHKQTVIRTVRVEYKDVEGRTITRPTTVYDYGTTFTDRGVTDGGVVDDGTTDGGTTGTATAEGANDGATNTGLQTGTDLRSIDGEDGTTIVDEKGQDLATRRIEDDETPLAGPDSAGAEAANKIANMPTEVVGAIGAGVLLALFMVFKRRKKNSDDSSNNDVTA